MYALCHFMLQLIILNGMTINTTNVNTEFWCLLSIYKYIVKECAKRPSFAEIQILVTFEPVVQFLWLIHHFEAISIIYTNMIKKLQFTN
jgi:hypothetical protein